jgi:hypothetical protein
VSKGPIEALKELADELPDLEAAEPNEILGWVLILEWGDRSTGLITQGQVAACPLEIDNSEIIEILEAGINLVKDTPRVGETVH